MGKENKVEGCRVGGGIPNATHGTCNEGVPTGGRFPRVMEANPASLIIIYSYYSITRLLIVMQFVYLMLLILTGTIKAIFSLKVLVPFQPIT